MLRGAALGLVHVGAAQVVVACAGLVVVARAGEVERQQEVRDLDALDLVALGLDRVAHLEPEEHRAVLRGIGMRADRELVGLRVADQLERLVRERDRPRLAQLLRDRGEDEAEGNAAVVLEVVAERAVHVALVPQVDHRVPAHVGGLRAVGLRSTPAFEPQRRPHAPMPDEVLCDLPVDPADRPLKFFVRHLSVRVVDDGDDHRSSSL